MSKDHFREWTASKAGMSHPPEGFHILLGVSGSVAAVKVPRLLEELSSFAEVRLRVLSCGQRD